MPIQSLPNELLSECFAHLTASKADIMSLRLVSKRFYATSSPFLVTDCKVSLTSKSFQDLEKLANHPTFSKSINTVTINASYYDKILARNLRRFAEHNASDLYQTIELLERASTFSRRQGTSDADWTLFNESWKIPDEWDKVGLPEFNASDATEAQKLIMDAHETYIKLFEDQETVMRNNGYLKRMVEALKKFPALKSIVIEDSAMQYGTKRTTRWIDELKVENLRRRCLTTSIWKGSFRTALDTEPPVHIISDVFTALAEIGIRPRKFEIKVTTPCDLRCLQMTAEQLAAVMKTLSHAEECYFRFSSWARRGSLAENNDRPRDEMKALCNLASAFFSSKHLKILHLSLDDYPCFYEIPTISLTNLLLLQKLSPNLKKVYFRNIPVTVKELQAFVTGTKSTLEWFNVSSPYMLKGNWAEALDVLRGLEALDHLELKYMKGGEFDDGRRYITNVPEEEIEKYVLGKNESNPLVGWVAQDYYSNQG